MFAINGPKVSKQNNIKVRHKTKIPERTEN